MNAEKGAKKNSLMNFGDFILMLNKYLWIIGDKKTIPKTPKKDNRKELS